MSEEPQNDSASDFGHDSGSADEALSDRQQAVLRAIVAGYVGEAAPVASATISHLLPVKISSASIRNTMAELSELGLIDKPHASAGRIPTERGLRTFVDRLMRPAMLEPWDRRDLAHCYEEVDTVRAARLTSQLLSTRTGQLGFVTLRRLEHVVLQHLSLVRVSSERVLAVLVSSTGQTHQRWIEDEGVRDQAELERVAALLNGRVCGRSLAEIRPLLERERAALRSEAGRLLSRALELGLQAIEAGADEEGDLVIATRLALLDQPEFHDPERVRELFAAIETQERLIEVLDRLVAEQVSVAIGAELDEPGLRGCAVVLAPYGSGNESESAGPQGPMGAVGVIGPSRMDFGRILPLVSYCSSLITEKFRP